MKKIGKQFAILLIIFLTINCKPKANEVKITNNPENLKRVWMLVAFSSFERKFLMDSEAQLNLTNSERAMAKMGCNTLSFDYKITNSEIIFSKGISTLMACTDMKLEDEFSKVITDFKKYKIDGHTLTLFNSKNEKMVFVAQDWD
jgi:heat shock protein HslJ